MNSFVMSFSLSNAPNTLMGFINNVFKPFVGKCIVGYFDGILIYSRSEEDHVLHLQEVLTVLQKNKVVRELEKVQLYVQQVIISKVHDKCRKNSW